MFISSTTTCTSSNFAPILNFKQDRNLSTSLPLNTIIVGTTVILYFSFQSPLSIHILTIPQFSNESNHATLFPSFQLALNSTTQTFFLQIHCQKELLHTNINNIINIYVLNIFQIVFILIDLFYFLNVSYLL